MPTNDSPSIIFSQKGIQCIGVIDDAFAVIDDLLASGRYARVFYSAEADGGLGTGIFTVADDVKAYIVDNLRALAG